MDLKIAVPKGNPPPVLPPTGVPSYASIIWKQFPRIGEKITMMWGSVELQKYLSNIIIDGRGNRKGFPPPVLTALLQVHKCHNKIVPEDKSDCIWNVVID